MYNLYVLIIHIIQEYVFYSPIKIFQCHVYLNYIVYFFYNVVYCWNWILVISFIRKGSLIVDYNVNVPAVNTTETYIIALDGKLNNAATNWTTFDNKSVDINRTKSAIKSESLFGCAFNLFMRFILISSALKNWTRIYVIYYIWNFVNSSTLLPAAVLIYIIRFDFVGTFLQSVCHCGTDEYVCVSEQTSLRCEHICNSTSAKVCGKDGHCVYDWVSRETKCLLVLK